MDFKKSADTALKFELFPKKIEMAHHKRRLIAYSPYQLGLFVSDALLAGLSIFFCMHVTGEASSLEGQAAPWVLLFTAAAMLIAFFPTYRLYSYHLIFSRKKHVKNLAKAFCWTLSMFGMVAFLYTWPALFNEHAVISGAAVFISISTLLLFGRFLRDHMLNFIKAMGISFLAVGIAGLHLGNAKPLFVTDPHTILWALPLSVLFIGGARYVLVHIVYNVWMRRHFRRQIGVVGSNREAAKIVQYVIEQNAPFWITGLIHGKAGCGLAIRPDKICLGALHHFPQIAAENQLDEVIVTDEAIDKRTLIALLDFCISAGITVWFPPKLLPIIDMKLYIDDFCGLPMIRMCSQKNNRLFAKIKHALDALITLPLFILQLPLFGAIAIAVKRDSKGPVFYRAKAVGQNGQEFGMLKFRSMRIDTASDIHRQYVARLIKGEIGRDHADSGPLKITNDPRITRIGRFLRKLSLDELPQLINVLKGEMSLVGPRPCLPYEYEIYKDWHKKRNSVRPGITGLWQVTGRSEVSFEEMILLDIYYIYNRNLMMDLMILYETIFVVFGKKGAY